MIILITYFDEKTNIRRVSHGINTIDDSIVILPDESLNSFNPKFDSKLGE